MASGRLPRELERQSQYLSALPQDFSFPLFNAKQAILSQRGSGYRNTASAARELVDNAVEAGADRVHVLFETTRNDSNRRLVSALAFIDNGSGMFPRMARFALSWGGGTHFNEPEFIGKFGFGLPNASINQTMQTEVYTRTGPDEPFTKAWLDVNDFQDFGMQSVPEPATSELPAFVQRYLDRLNWQLDHGTVVVWIAPDRMTYKRPSALKEHLLQDFGVTYRYLLADPAQMLELVVDGVDVEAVDPLFLMPGARYYVPPDEGGAQRTSEFFMSVRYEMDRATGERHLVYVDAASGASQTANEVIATGQIHVQVARFPVGFAEQRDSGRWPMIPDHEKRFEIRKPRRGMSFVRAGREIETVDVFPKSDADRAHGMGQWPLLQTYAYYWGVEVRFLPELDDVFGIGNDKQSVRPVEDFWRVLALAGVDEALRRENAEQSKLRQRAYSSDNAILPTSAELAARDADLLSGNRLNVPTERSQDAEGALEFEAGRRGENSLASASVLRDEVLRETKGRPYRVEYVDDINGPFYDPLWFGRQVLVRINRLHPFYDLLYSSLQRENSQVTQDAIELLLIALARGELNATGAARAFYESERRQVWSPYLDFAFRSLRTRIDPEEEAVAG